MKKMHKILPVLVHRIALVFYILCAALPYLAGALFLRRRAGAQKRWLFALGVLFPAVLEKAALYWLGAFLCGVAPTDVAGVMEAAADSAPFVKLFTQPSARYALNILFFNWTYIAGSLLFAAFCAAVFPKRRSLPAAP